MPKKFPGLEEAFKESASPIMMFLSKGEIASKKTVIRAFSDGNGFNLVSNIDKIYNPATGDVLPYIEKSQQTCEGDSFKQLDELIAMRTDDDVVVGVDADLAFALGGESAYCPLTGKETVFHYMEAAEDSSNDSEEEFEAIDDSLNSDSDSDSDDEKYSDDEEEDVFTDREAEEDSNEEEVMDSTIDDEPVSESASEETTEQTAVTEPTVEQKIEPVEAVAAEPVTEQASEEVNEATVQEVPAIAIADDQAALKLVTLTTDNSEVAAFVGDTHVGTLRRLRASEKAAALFSDGSKLVAAFKPVFNMNRDNQNSSELAAYGYKPVTFKIKVGDLYNKRLEKETASINTQAEEKVKSSINDMARLIELSFVGINKGLFDCDNELANELASLLARNGVKNANREVRRTLAKHSHGYIKAGVEKAKELSSKSEDYIQGIAETVSKSEFVGSLDEDTTTHTETAAYVPPVSTVETAEFIGNRDTKKPAFNKYSRLFR